MGGFEVKAAGLSAVADGPGQMVVPRVEITLEEDQPWQETS